MDADFKKRYGDRWMEVKMAVTNHYNKLVDEYRKLDTEIKSSEETYVLDIDVKKLKKRKLHLKDEIAILEGALHLKDEIEVLKNKLEL